MSFDGTDNRFTGFQLGWEESECVEKTIQHADQSVDSCKSCWSGLTDALDPGQVHEVTVNWSLDN